jgi:hypothetical protein
MNYSRYDVTHASWHAGEFIVINFDIKCGVMWLTVVYKVTFGTNGSKGASCIMQSGLVTPAVTCLLGAQESEIKPQLW